MQQRVPRTEYMAVSRQYDMQNKHVYMQIM